MQNTDELISKGLDVLGKIVEDKPEPEEPDMGGGGEPPQQQMIEQQHDHEEHFSLYHEYMTPIWAAAITTMVP